MSKEPITYIVNKKDKNKGSKAKKIFLILIKTILILIILALVAVLVAEAMAYFYIKNVYISISGEFDDLVKKISTYTYANSKIVDIEGNELATLNGDEKREIVTLKEMSPYLPKAYVSIEDERFMEHHGVDIKRTAKAILNYVQNDGESSFGGSSITQQLVKNITNNKEKTVDRKVKEWILAYELEDKLSKDTILEKYLNIIFVGSDVYGVELGAEHYFSKKASELTLPECAFLAGITHSPNAYNPFGREDNSKIINERTKTVLGKMFELGNITQTEYIEAIAEVNAGLNFKEGKELNTVYSYHTDAALNQVIKDMAEKENISEALAKSYIYSNGLTIYTTQNPSIQATMEEEFKKPEYVLPSKKNEGETTQAAMAIIDHKTGFVLGCVGGLGEKNVSRGLNRATQSTRQTGSSMKPIAVVGPALQEGIITPASIYGDNRTTFTLKDGTKYTPYNYNYYRGNITVRDAIETSQNIPFVKIMEQLTTEKSREYLKKMGITTLTDNDIELALAIGGLDRGITPLEMAGAYATIANDGVYIEPTFYTKVVDKNGNVVLEANQRKERVYSEAVAYVLKDLLTQPVKGRRGTATYCAMQGIDVAAKTGTTDNENDRWLCGFTPYYTAATWYGYDYNETVNYGGKNPAGVIWSNIMKKIHIGLDQTTFQKPEGVETVKICRNSGLRATSRCWSTYNEIVATEHMPEYCTKHTYRRTSTSTSNTVRNQIGSTNITLTNETTGTTNTVNVPNN